MEIIFVFIHLLTTVVLSTGCMPKKDAIDFQSGDVTPIIMSSYDVVLVPTVSEVDIAPVVTVPTVLVDKVVVAAVQTAAVAVPAVQFSPATVPAVQVAPVMVQVAPFVVPAVQVPSVMVPTVQITPVVIPGVNVVPEVASPVNVDNVVAQPVNVATDGFPSELVEPVTTEAVESSTVLLQQIDAEPVVVHATDVVGEVGHNFDDDYYQDEYDRPSQANYHPHVIIVN